MNNKSILFGAITILLGGVLAVYGYRNFLAPAQPEPTPTVDVQAVFDPGLVSAEGRVVPSESLVLGFSQAGRVSEVGVSVGDEVRPGETLARLDTAYLSARVEEARAAQAVAEAGLEAARVQLELARQAAQSASVPARTDAWRTPAPAEMEQPAWYFEREAQLNSARAEIESARSFLDREIEGLQSLLEESGGQELLAIEERLSDAQAAFMVAREVRERANAGRDSAIQEQARRQYDVSLSELEAAQDRYDDLLSTEEAEDILEARATVAVARERYEAAIDRLNQQLYGDESLEVQAAEQALRQAESGLEQARAALAVAEQSLGEALLAAPRSGLIVQSTIEVGSVVVPGQQAFVLADLSAWQVETTDLVESDVVLLAPGMQAMVSLDAFPGQSFPGIVREIDYLSEDVRGSVTYRVIIDFDPGDAPVRWGMTAFVDIQLP
jgi:multidrug resistance efflux pump